VSGLDVALLVADTDCLARLYVGTLNDAAKLLALTEEAGTAIEILDGGDAIRAKYPTNRFFCVRTNDGTDDIGAVQRLQQQHHTVEKLDLIRFQSHPGAHLAGDLRQSPHWNTEAADDFAIVAVSQILDFMICDTAKAIARCQSVEDRNEPADAVGQCSIEVEDGKLITQFLQTFWIDPQQAFGAAIDLCEVSSTFSQNIIGIKARHGDLVFEECAIAVSGRKALARSKCLLGQ